MRILAPSLSSISRLFPEKSASFELATPSEAFASFAWDDATFGPQEFIVHDNERKFPFSLGIIEDFSNSSQFDRLRTWHGPAVWAIAFDGKGFHGQLARKWLSMRGNLFLSLAMPTVLPLDSLDKIQRLPAEILALELKKYDNSAFETRIKPPNDVVVQFLSGTRAGSQHKIAGFLTEMRVSGQCITQIRYGIGMNLVFAPTMTDPEHLPACALTGIYGDILPKDALLPHFFNLFLSKLALFIKNNDV